MPVGASAQLSQYAMTGSTHNPRTLFLALSIPSEHIDMVCSRCPVGARLFIPPAGRPTFRATCNVGHDNLGGALHEPPPALLPTRAKVGNATEGGAWWWTLTEVGWRVIVRPLAEVVPPGGRRASCRASAVRVAAAQPRQSSAHTTLSSNSYPCKGRKCSWGWCVVMGPRRGGPGLRVVCSRVVPRRGGLAGRRQFVPRSSLGAGRSPVRRQCRRGRAPVRFDISHCGR